MGRPLDLKGLRFGKLTVVEQAPNRVSKSGDSRRAWLCVCDCGNTTTVTTLDLRKGDVKSCGCYKKEVNKAKLLKHGEHNTHLHNVWCAMRRRCRDSNQDDYAKYGGRGIKVCDEWQDYAVFKDWALSHGYQEDLTIDRINVDGDYCPDNCRWATMKTQANNRSNTIYITHNGVTRPLSEWAEIINISYTTLYMRLKKGWSIEKALSTQLQH